MTETTKTYPKVEPVLNKPVYLRLRFDTPKEMDNSAHPDWGKSFLWGVDEYDGITKVWIQKSWFASEKMNQTILNLLLKKGEQFQIIKRADENTKTKKPYTYYELIHKGKLYDTRDTELTSDENEPIPEKPPEDIPPGEPPPPSFPIANTSFEYMATEVWNTAMDYIVYGMDIDSELTPAQEKLLALRMEIVKMCPQMVNTMIIQIMQNGGKK